MWAPVQTRLFLAEDHLVISTIKGLIVLSICVCILLQPQFSSSSGRLTISVTYGIEGPINHTTVHGGLYSGCSLSRYNSTLENWYSQSWGQSWLYLSRRTVQILGVVPSHISTIHLWGKHSPLLSESYLALTSWHLYIYLEGIPDGLTLTRILLCPLCVYSISLILSKVLLCLWINKKNLVNQVYMRLGRSQDWLWGNARDPNGGDFSR